MWSIGSTQVRQAPVCDSLEGVLYILVDEQVIEIVIVYSCLLYSVLCGRTGLKWYENRYILINYQFKSDSESSQEKYKNKT